MLKIGTPVILNLGSSGSGAEIAYLTGHTGKIDNTLAWSRWPYDVDLNVCLIKNCQCHVWQGGTVPVREGEIKVIS